MQMTRSVNEKGLDGHFNMLVFQIIIIKKKLKSNLLLSEDSHQRFLGEAGKINFCVNTINITVKKKVFSSAIDLLIITNPKVNLFIHTTTQKPF